MTHQKQNGFPPIDPLKIANHVYNESTRSYERPEHSTMASMPQVAQLESTVRNEPLGKAKVPRRPKVKAVLRFSQFTRRRQDPDNVCGKFHTDFLRANGFISDDTDDDVAITVQQIQVFTKEEEGVLIELSFPD